MQTEKKYNLMFKLKLFTIPSNIIALKDFDTNIYNILITEQLYEVKSNVHVELFESFIRHWINNETPDINLNNIDDFVLLSQEFDRMQNLIHLFQRKTPNALTSSLIQKNLNIKNKILRKTEILKEKVHKNHQIIEILFKESKFDTISDFLKVKSDLKNDCIEENISYVKIFLRKKIEQNGFSFYLNEEDKTASLFHILGEKDSVCIPRSVNYNSQEYVITEIFQNSFECSTAKSIEFSEDSEILSIDGYSFSESSVENLTIPASLADLKKGWCHYTDSLSTVKVSPNNKKYKNFGEEFVIGKSDQISSEFDVLLFVPRSAEKVKNPSFIKKIESYAFHECDAITSIEFDDDSELLSIDNYGFAGSSVESIVIPSHVYQIGANSFANCTYLTSVIFSENSELQIINEYAFTESMLQSIVIPSSVTRIAPFAFSYCNNLKKVEFLEDSKISSFEPNIFNGSQIESLSIPAGVVDLEEGWCSNVRHLTNINLSQNNLHFSYYEGKFILGKTDPKSDIYDNLLFAKRDIEKAEIPSFIKKIGPHAFSQCNGLKTVEFPEDTQINSIGKYAFYESSLESILVATHIVEIGSFAFAKCKSLNEFVFMENCELKLIDHGTFSGSSLKAVYIPTFVTRIKEQAFSSCRNLYYVEFAEDSHLEVIEKHAFSNTSLEDITIPKSVKEINESAFAECIFLSEIKFAENSELKTIGENALANTSITELRIPSSVEKLEKGWCCGMLDLTNILIDLKNPYFSIFNKSMVIGKSSLYGKYYDVLHFASRNVTICIIPPFIKTIAPYAFDECSKLRIVACLNNSQLTKIGANSFSGSFLRIIWIPPSVACIDDYAFFQCRKLIRLDFLGDSNLRTIKKYAFYGSSLKSIAIPSKVKRIGDCAFSICTQLVNVDFLDDSELEFLGNEVFSYSSINAFFIPSNVSFIGKHAFSNCYKLDIVEIGDNSKLKSLDKEVFLLSPIKILVMPSNLSETIQLNF
ncbi:hypothetical protein M9Y10_014906 [Tritrichomonas musculus]|uniref:Surface antigen BspA-like n=1 Tax=Tritrichomonas musculus TaxID=1915356 RepID=A0ABR2L1N8_9EUKA